ncbi:MAG: hypothetical protein D6800_13335, partial [Candidatus Zixiibacteriota bacterium]
MLTCRRLIMLLSASALLITLCTCSKNGTKPTEPPGGIPAVLTVTPDGGPPGTLLHVTGLQIDSSATYTAILGGAAAPVRPDGDTLLLVAIPLFYDSTLGWSKPPTGPVTLEIDKDGQPV